MVKIKPLPKPKPINIPKPKPINIGNILNKVVSGITSVFSIPALAPRNYEAEKYRKERDEITRTRENWERDEIIRDKNNILSVEKEEKRIGEIRLRKTESIIHQNYMDYLKKKNTYFDSRNSSVISIINTFLKNSQAEKNDLIEQVTNENVQIQKQLQHNITYGNKSKYVKSDYQQIELDKISTQNKPIYYFFYSLVFILGIIVYYYYQFKNIPLLIIIVVLLFFPFLIYHLEMILYFIYTFLKKVLDTTPFSNVYLGDY